MPIQASQEFSITQYDPKWSVTANQAFTHQGEQLRFCQGAQQMQQDIEVGRQKRI